MNIAIWHNLPSGGASRALHQHIKGLAERGHSIEIWTSSLADSHFLDVDRYVSRTHILPLSIATRLRTEYLDDVRSLLFLNSTRINRMMDFCQACAQEIEQGNFDVLFANSCHYFNMPYIGRFITRIPKLLYLQEPNRSLYEAYPSLVWQGLPPLSENYLNWPYYKQYVFNQLSVNRARVLVREESRNYATYDKVLVNSFFSNESLLRAYGSPGNVCYLGVDHNLFTWLDRPREPFVLGLGSFHPPKQPDLAIRAIAQIPESIRPKLVWIGNIANKDYMNELLALSAQLQVNFEPRQYIPHEELVVLLNTASCLIYPSALEPFGFAPLEANACGLPVVAVAEGGVRETVIDGYNGLLTSREPKHIAQTISRVLTDSALAKQLSSNGRQIVLEQWGVKQAVDRIENYLFTVVNPNRKNEELQPVSYQQGALESLLVH